MNTQKTTSPTTKDKILHTAMSLMLTKGYMATGIDEICKMAGVTKGSFFHYFATKEVLGIAILDYFWSFIQDIPDKDKFQLTDPRELLYAYLDSFLEIAQNPVISYSCLFGNFVQEIAATHPALRQRCEEGFTRWEELLYTCIEAVKKTYPPVSSIDAKELSRYFIAMFEGALLLAKAHQEPQIVVACIKHYKLYITSLFPNLKGGENKV